MNVIITPRARRHLKEIKQYIASQSYPSRANAYVGRIFDACEKLSDFPQRGTRYDDIMLGLRIIGFEGSASIAFTVTQDSVIIEGVFYGGRSIETLLEATP